MAESIETVIVGGGQAGLATSYFLKRFGHEHIVLEKAAQAGNVWRNDRWDSFTLVTPNWAFRLPGAEYSGDQPDAFMPRAELVQAFEDYVETFQLPVQYGVCARAVEPRPPDGAKGLKSGYRVETDAGVFQAANVVIAIGLYQQPRIPSLAAQLPPDVLQLASGKYANPDALPPGAVLVVGSAQSGCQIAEELYQAGRKVYLCVGRAGRVPRRYRGRDIFEWAKLIGFVNRTAAQLPSPQIRFAGNPHVSGKGGGHTLNLHQFARDGVVLLGRLQDAAGGKVSIAPDLREKLEFADQFERDFIRQIDGTIEKNGMDAPEETLPALTDGYRSPAITQLDFRREGIRTVIWATGYRFDFSLVKLPVLEESGFPMAESGATAYPGLYFAGLPWLPYQKTGLLLGVGEHAAGIAEIIVGNSTAARIS
jgi:putative flavoprotein involved in K+ transport